jgi:hypothetical protein
MIYNITINGFIINKCNLYKSILERLKNILNKEYLLIYIDSIFFLFGFIIDNYFEYTFKLVLNKNTKLIDLIIKNIYAELTLSTYNKYIYQHKYTIKFDRYILKNNISNNEFINFDDICDIEILLELL